MSFLAPLAAVDPTLAAMFTFSSGPLQVPNRQLHYSNAITAQEQISDRMEADPPGSRSSNQDVLPSAPVTVQAESQLRSPTDEAVVELFERIHKNRPDFVFLPGDMRKTLETQLRWNVERNRITKLWERVTRSAAHNGGSIILSPAEEESEQIEKLQSDIITSAFSSAGKKINKIYLSALTKQAVAETTLGEQMTLTSPSTIEIMTFLWELEEGHPRVIENTHNLLILMKWQKCWQVSEERLDRILIEMDQADAEDVFAMPMTNTLRSSHQRNSTGMASGASNDAVHSATVAARERPASPAASAPASFPQKQILRNAIRTRVLSQRPEHACKITEMLLELDKAELLMLLEDDDALYVRIEGLFNLYVHYADSYSCRAAGGAEGLALEVPAKVTPDTRIRDMQNELLALSKPNQAPPSSVTDRSDDNDDAPCGIRDKSLKREPKRRRYA